MKNFTQVLVRTQRALRNEMLLLAFLVAAIFVVMMNLNIKPLVFSGMMFGGDNGQQQITTISPVAYDLVFVSRKINKHGDNKIDSLNDMPGIGTHSRFRPSAPGKLQIYKTDGTLITLIDGSNPTVASLNLIDVSAPEVSYDGTQILFAGLPAPPPGFPYDTIPNWFLGAWRIYKINVNGTCLTQLTFTNQVMNLTQFVSPVLQYVFSKYDDTDPCWLPDGRICFTSSRYPSFTHYGGTRATNLFVMDANGSNLHRITTERNGADRAMVDPQTGQIVYSRWWRNQRFPIEDMSTLANANSTGYIRKDGLSSDPLIETGGPFFMYRNGWHLAAINPDGSNLEMFSGGSFNDDGNQAYGGSFTSTGDVITYVSSNNNLFERGGFGGIRKMKRGVAKFTNLIGLTDKDSGSIAAPSGTVDSLLFMYSTDGYAADPEVMPDGKIVMSWCSDYKQDYGLFVMNGNGTGKKLIYNAPGTSELHARAIRVRTVPPVITDVITQVASNLPPTENGPYNTDGTFTFNCLNVYSNGPVDMDIPNAPAIGSAASIRFFVDHQRQRIGTNEEQEWPILLSEIPVGAGGAVLNTNAPANVPLFEQIRTSVSSNYMVPFTGVPFNTGTTHVAGLNYGRPGAISTCVGCHRSHTLIPVPANAADAEFTNLAPGATVTTSSAYNIYTNNFLVDRKVTLTKNQSWYWVSAFGNVTNQWAQLGFNVPIKVRKVRVYNIPTGGPANSTLQVNKIKVSLYADKNGTQLVTSKTITKTIKSTGTDVLFTDVVAQSVKVQIMDITGTFYNVPFAGLAEIEVIASGNAGNPKYEQPTANSISLTAFPNPVIDKLELKINGITDQDFTYKVYDINGKLVKQGIVNDTNEPELIQMKDLKNGLYLIKVSSASFEEIIKVMKE